MDIPALSVMLSQNKVQQQAATSVMKLAMGTASEQSEAVTALMQENTKAMELSVQPHLGANLDIRA